VATICINHRLVSQMLTIVQETTFMKVQQIAGIGWERSVMMIHYGLPNSQDCQKSHTLPSARLVHTNIKDPRIVKVTTGLFLFINIYIYILFIYFSVYLVFIMLATLYVSLIHRVLVLHMLNYIIYILVSAT